MTQSKAAALFKPFEGGRLKLDNRIVMAPMTRSFSPDGIPGPNVAGYYRRRAENGVGLIITEGTLINHPAAGADHDVPHFYGEAALEGWARVVREVHEAGGKIAPQIWHTGTAREHEKFPDSDADPIGPSGLSLTGERVSEPLTVSEIKELVQAYAQAAADAKRIGFDAVELHGAHGYLIDQFFWEATNKRTDEYGGDLVGRTRFAVEVIEAVRAAVGPDFPIIFRFSQWKPVDYSAKLAAAPEELERFLAPLSAAGVDIFHASTRRFWEPEFAGSDLNLAGWTRKLTGKPAITVGSVGLNSEFTSLFESGKGGETASIDNLIERLEREEFDLVAVGRALLTDPAWAAKIRDGRLDELQPFTREALGTLS
ncbi:NADH:flavin oxidoreductase [Paenibacillus macerans]|uniref:Flavin oxidoreductase / NADH oxidase family protein n=1 Tax=Paenibacillus macerans TaxID=44252 RepID=A0A090YS74_PAEMA|nr:NADH:flavin oxidoreductase [Paenibacillus macerans]KFM94965.1 flavin oxidoreductase / NADH oxidase family protein [Paenibacillus macerans]MCY7560431.1 NADH:flavin oxidoreductase [Paenibacillus macerans]MEC0153434.1 NADH:flavin oxidoreductase [Paenibacillus macerans]SUD26050.1 NADH-dependent flavin oxidoreductase [Paenibacillus macerans]GIP14187.1 12-oxophytodienoate reductase [Paenibacillus macerans]